MNGTSLYANYAISTTLYKRILYKVYFDFSTLKVIFIYFENLESFVSVYYIIITNLT